MLKDSQEVMLFFSFLAHENNLDGGPEASSLLLKVYNMSRYSRFVLSFICELGICDMRSWETF